MGMFQLIKSTLLNILLLKLHLQLIRHGTLMLESMQSSPKLYTELKFQIDLVFYVKN